jgi:hypothetical protein
MKVTLLQNISYKEKLTSDAKICIEVTALKLNIITLWTVHTAQTQSKEQQQEKRTGLPRIHASQCT